MHRSPRVACFVAATLTVLPPLAQAGPLLDRALERANRLVVQPASITPSYTTAAAEGETDAQRLQGTGGWVAGGIFLPILMPIVAHVTTPQPLPSLAMRYSADDARCYSMAYSETASAKRKRERGSDLESESGCSSGWSCTPCRAATTSADTKGQVHAG